MSKIRLDQLVFEKGYAESREKAKALIMSGDVFIAGQRTDKPGLQVNEDTELDVRSKGLPFVSRGGYKLDKAISVFNIVCADKICIDCGASTGGFTDVLLQNGATKVYSVDVGYGQLAWKLRNDSRVVCLERTNLRYVDSEIIPEMLDLAVCDVSFISLKLVMPAVKSLLRDDAEILCLIKPQFEAGRDKVGKKGVVRDISVHREVVCDIIDFMRNAGFGILGLDYSPIKGPEGNIEYLCYMSNEPSRNVDIDIEQVVQNSHSELD